MNIYEKMLAIMNDVQYLAKDSRVKFGSTDYKAMSEEKVTTIMRDELIKQKLTVFPIAMASSREGQISHVDVVYRLVNAENPEEYIDIASCGDGYDTQDKGAGKAMTYAFKYMWLRTFAIPTGEDPDKISSEEITANQNKAKRKFDDSILDAANPEPHTVKYNPIKCSECGIELESNVANFSLSKWGVPLCRTCQKKRGAK